MSNEAMLFCSLVLQTKSADQGTSQCWKVTHSLMPLAYYLFIYFYTQNFLHPLRMKIRGVVR